MALVTCAECGTQISDQAIACVKCGAPAPAAARPERPRRVWPWVIAAPVVLFFAYGFYASNTPEGQEKSRARRAIELCWDGQSRKSLDPGSQRHAASMCEAMEAAYASKYGRRP